MRGFSLFFFVFAFFLGGCKKKVAETIITGRVYSDVESLPVQGANVKFYISVLSNNSFSSSYELDGEVNTGSNGTFSFPFLKTSSDVGYKIRVTDSEYQFIESEINPSDIEAGIENVFDQIIIPVGVANFSIKAGSSSSVNDEFVFNFNNNLLDGDSFINQFFIGNQIDTVLVTDVIAEKYASFSYVVKRNGQYLFVDDSIFCNKGSVVVKEIIY